MILPFLLFLSLPLFGCYDAAYQCDAPQKLKIGLCVMATGKYVQFVWPLFASMQKHFLADHDVYLFVFTDRAVPHHPRIIPLYQKRLGWPYDTMLRFHVYYKYRDILKTMDYLFASDVDMLFVNRVGNEILGDLVATISPGFYHTGRKEDYERNPKSHACIEPNKGKHYFAGGFWGGKTERFLEACGICGRRIAKDLCNGVIAKYHDESHWNCYCQENQPTVVLTPEYCSPDSRVWVTLDGVRFYPIPCSGDRVEYTSVDGHVCYTKRLVALDKDHKAWQTAT